MSTTATTMKGLKSLAKGKGGGGGGGGGGKKNEEKVGDNVTNPEKSKKEKEGERCFEKKAEK